MRRGQSGVLGLLLCCLFLWVAPACVGASSLPILPFGLWGPLRPESSVPATFGRMLSGAKGKGGVKRMARPHFMIFSPYFFFPFFFFLNLFSFLKKIFKFFSPFFGHLSHVWYQSIKRLFGLRVSWLVIGKVCQAW